MNNVKKGSDFTRKRKLPFHYTLLLILQKSVKSLQLILNEFYGKLDRKLETVTSSAFTQARSKLLHTVYIELNKECVIPLYYEEASYKTWFGQRVFAVDGSYIILPQERELEKVFDTIPIKNQHMMNEGAYVSGLVSVCYDVLNNIVIDGMLAPARSSEISLAYELFDSLGADDVVVLDRVYTSYCLLATLAQRGIHYVARCKRGSFKDAQKLFEHDIPSLTVTLAPSNKSRNEVKKKGLPARITVRFVRVILDTGEVEVLATSFLNEDKYPTQCFKELYGFRWCIETYFDLIKERLNLENFSGRTVESVLQDFYATIFLSNLETALTEDVQNELDLQSSHTIHPQKVNKAVSFNAIKNHVFELLSQEGDTELIVERLMMLFHTTPTIVRKGRKVPRQKKRATASIGYYKRRKKECY